LGVISRHADESSHFPYIAEVQRALDWLPADWGPPFIHYRILARGPQLLDAYLQSVAYSDPKHLTVRQREVFLLRVTGRCRNAFEWLPRVRYFAESSGLTDAQLEASVQGTPHDEAWEPNDRLLIRLADELHDTASVSDGLWSDLRSDFTQEALLQLILMAGHYPTNAYLAAGLRLPVEPRVKRQFPSR
jgi:hypothetical protein